MGVGRTHSHMAFPVSSGKSGQFGGHRLLPPKPNGRDRAGDLLEEAGAPPLGL